MWWLEDFNVWAWLEHVHCKCVHVKMLEFALLIVILYCIERESCEEHKSRDRNPPRSRFIVIALFLRWMLAKESGAVLIVRDTIIWTHLTWSSYFQLLSVIDEESWMYLFCRKDILFFSAKLSITVKSKSAWDLQSQSWYVRVLDSAPAQGLCVTEFELSVVI